MPTKLLLMLLTTSIIPLTILFSVMILSNPAIEDLLELSARDSGVEEWMAIMPHAIQLLLSAGIMVFSILVALSMNSSFRFSFVRPLDLLIEKMNLVKDGDYNQHTTVFSNDEIGQLKSRFNEMLDGLKQREFMRDTFGKYLSPEISKKILENQTLELGGEEVEATVLFMDIEKFTSLSETLHATQVVSLLNSLFSDLHKPIVKNSGVVNKYIGDSMMVLFGVPEKTSDHRQKAVLASLQMLSALKQWNETSDHPNQLPIRIGIGIHTGNVVAGNIGARDRMEYTVIGDVVNVAARIESHTRKLQSALLISEEVYKGLSEELLESVAFKKTENIQVKGRSQTLTLYSLDEEQPTNLPSSEPIAS